ncbi:MAG TPA: helix-turn-helix domain-containing protein [Dehalococcoidia bacterium]|nr:helix-turn-helix domain-containing protein [Dehalococcoidia bacterium]
MIEQRPGDLDTRIARHAALLFGSWVGIYDRDGRLIAGSGEPPDDGYRSDDGRAALRMSMEIGGRPVEIEVGQASIADEASARLARVIMELVVRQSTLLDALPDGRQLKDALILELLNGTARDEEELRREAEIVGIDCTPPRAVILVDAADYLAIVPGEDVERSARRRASRVKHVVGVIVQYFKLPSDAICGYIGEGEVAVLKASTAQDLARWLDDDRDVGDPSWTRLSALKRACAGLLDRLRRETGCVINIAVGRYHPGIHGLARSYSDARAALSLGRSVHGGNRVHCLDELGIAAFMGPSDTRTKAELAAHLLSPLRDERELMETLDAFFAESCNMTATANRLSIHRNTLGYRLDKIASLTGLDPRRFDDAVQMRLATVLRSI